MDKPYIDAVTPLPHAEAIDYWRQRMAMSPEDFAVLTKDDPEAAFRAFSVTGIAKISALKEIHSALQNALVKGESFGDFEKRIKEQITAQKWGSRRVETIFRTNIQTAYNAGHWKRYAQDGVDVLVYDAVGDSRTRPTHLALDGKAFRRTDKFWDEWFPPNGFGCRCTTQGMSAIEAEARGIKIENGGDISNLSVVLPGGQQQQLVPDRGFEFNPGKTMFGRQANIPSNRVSAKPDEDIVEVGPANLVDWAQCPAHESPSPRLMTDAELTGELQSTIESGLLDYKNDPIVLGDVERFVTHTLRRHRNARVPVMQLMADTISHPDECWCHKRRVRNVTVDPDTKAIEPDERMRLHQIYMKKRVFPSGETTTHIVVTDWVGTGWQPITLYDQVDPDEVEGKRVGVPFKAITRVGT